MRTLTRNKKGMTVGDIYPVILVIAITAVLIGVVMFVMEEFTQTGNEIVTVYNETSSAVVGEKGVVITNASVCGFHTFSVFEVWNRTNASAAQDVNSSSYSYDSTNGRVYSTGHESNGSYWNISYRYETWKSTEACDAIDDTIDDFVDFIPWIGIILLVIAAAIVLGIVISSFSKKRGV